MKKVPVAVLASGSGSNFQSLVEGTREGSHPAEICLLVTSRADIGALERAKLLGVPSVVVSKSNFSSVEQWDEVLAKLLLESSCEYVFLAGFTQHIGLQVLRAFPGRILNTHPGPLPEFGGQGMYGRRVHEAVLKSGRKSSEICVHIVDEEYDHGPVVAKKEVAVLTSDTPEDLERRVREIENSFVVEVLKDFLNSKT